MTFIKNILKNLCHKNNRPGIADHAVLSHHAHLKKEKQPVAGLDPAEYAVLAKTMIKVTR